MNLLKNVFDAVANVKRDYEKANPPLLDAANDGDVRRVARLLEAGADVNTRSKAGMTALHWALFSNSAGVAALLLEHGADVNARDNHGRTPLHFAAEHGDDRFAALLLEAHADVNARDAAGRSPLHIALDDRIEGVRRALLLPSRAKVAAVLREWGGVD